MAPGRVLSTGDPAGKANRYEYDDAWRQTKLVENVLDLLSGGSGFFEASGSTGSASSSSDDCEPSADTDRTTEYSYTADSLLEELKVWNLETGDQTTTYTYGSTLSDSRVASSLLLRQVSYPGTGGTVTMAYNGQGQRTRFSDQRGCIHEYGYDLGRLTDDRVTTLGSSVDGAVRRLATCTTRSHSQN